MDDRVKLLELATIDKLLVEEFGVRDLLTDDQSDKFIARVADVYETDSQYELRDALIDLGRQLYAELFEREDVE